MYSDIVSLRRAIGCLALFIVAGLAHERASAQVQFTGDVIPMDIPSFPGSPSNENEGIPTDGNFVNRFESATDQTFYEGRHVEFNPDITTDDENINFDIIVGQKFFGTLLIQQQTALRDQHLIIGDSGQVVQDGPILFGRGIMRIEGFGALYNNDPEIINLPPPYNLPINFHSQTPRPDGVGYDLYVGRTGDGTLSISGGGRAEIEDGVFVGDFPTGIGALTVDGIDSFLGSGGFGEGSANEFHTMIIGRRGTGRMTISGGGTVHSEAPPSGGPGADAVPGAVIGSDPFDDEVPEGGGLGTVTVTDAYSDWSIGGSLQIGGFDLAEDAGGGDDFEGDNAIYNPEAGHGTLYVQNGGLVSVHLGIDADPQQEELRLVIGRFGRLELNGGTVVIGAGAEEESREDTVQVLNDGLIKGGGRIDTGVFRNRYLGQIRVDPGQDLIINSTSQFETDDDIEPIMNFGLMEIYGTPDQRAEIEILRAPGDAEFPLRPFFNTPLDPDTEPRSFEGGVINAHDATLRFGSGIQTRGVMAFTGGENVITGQVDNVAGTTNGRFLISTNTEVVVEGDFSSGGIVNATPIDEPILSLGAGAKLTVLEQSSFTMSGHLDMQVSLNNPSRIEVTGDVGLNGDLFVSFAPDAFNSLSHGDAFELIYFAGFIGGVDATDPTHPIPDLTANPVLNVVPDATFDLLYPDLDLIAARITQSYYLLVLDPTLVGPGGGGASGPDFNGDGFVDALDLAIWQANVGLSQGASVLQGDADGDGDVDGDDFLIWQGNLGPYPGAGGGGENGLAAVPEPTGLALLVSGAMLSLALRRKRTAS